MKHLLLVPLFLNLFFGQTYVVAYDNPNLLAGQESASAGEGEDDGNYETQSLILKNRMEACTEQFKAIKKPSRSLALTYERCLKLVSDGTREIDKQIEESNRSKLQLAELNERIFSFDIIPNDQRMQYVNDGRSAIKKAVHAMRGHSEAQQVEGISLFENVVRTNYRGIPEYTDAKNVCVELLAKLSKKWNRSMNALTKARGKLNSSAAEKSAAADARVYEKIKKNMEAENKDIEKDWFAPSQNNVQLIEHAYNRANALLKTLTNDRTEDDGKTEEKLQACWKNLDEVCSMMQRGETNEALEALRGNEALSAVRSLREGYIDNEYRDKLVRQIDALRSEVRERMRTSSKLNSSLKRNDLAIIRAFSSAERQLDRLETELARYKGEQKETRADRTEDSFHSEKVEDNAEEKSGIENEKLGQDDDETPDNNGKGE